MSAKKMVEETTFQVIEELEKSGKLNHLIRRGVIAVDWIDHLNIYRTFKKYRDEGVKVMESYKTTAVIHSIHYNTVIYIRKKMES